MRVLRAVLMVMLAVSGTLFASEWKAIGARKGLKGRNYIFMDVASATVEGSICRFWVKEVLSTDFEPFSTQIDNKEFTDPLKKKFAEGYVPPILAFRTKADSDKEWVMWTVMEVIMNARKLNPQATIFYEFDFSKMSFKTLHAAVMLPDGTITDLPDDGKVTYIEPDSSWRDIVKVVKEALSKKP